MKRVDILDREQEIRNWIKEKKPKAFICRMLNCKPETLNSYLAKMKINYKGNIGRKGIKLGRYRRPISYYLRKNGPYINSHRLKIKLIEEGIKKHECEKCKLHKWMNNIIPLELHHVNGNKFDNRFKNLQILCPNCHAQKDNNSGAAKKLIPKN